ncbi:hypothetical protein U717_03930 [Rhodobacter capsulatus R121]|jgi:hypothetical protein|nr:hypothetical protein U714_03925 [Rhodobacter capsulatus DE442]ETD79031.1 hypothetical protein U717_03930 [Rhodobacter capsulatus R121]ETE54946.1 hypothetical protein U715_03920 [Rhodobacter capsulatus Y262]
MASFPRSHPAQTGLGWRDFFERLGQGTLPQGPRRSDRPAPDPIRSFNGQAIRPVSR